MREAGVHRPNAAAIAGREDEGCFSIVVGGGFWDDQVSRFISECRGWYTHNFIECSCLGFGLYEGGDAC